MCVFQANNSITHRNKLVANGVYPLIDNNWLKIPDVICLFVDIRNSTGLSAITRPESTAFIYELFSGTAVRIFHHLGASYIDIKGDGVFALFNSNEVHRAFVTAVTFKTFAQEQFLPKAKSKLDSGADIGFHMGIDQMTVLVKQLGLRDADGRESRKNEVWAGKPINMAVKLAARSEDGELLVSDRYYQKLSKNNLVQKTCICNSREPEELVNIWKANDITKEKLFDFDWIYSMRNLWCYTHGKQWAENILLLDGEIS